jgi:two-component system, OmpR family, response regulator
MAKNKKIVILDQCPDFRMLVVKLLNDAGFDCIPGDGVRDALTALNGQREGIHEVGLICTAMRIKGGGGPALVKAVRSHAEYDKTPILIVSGTLEGVRMAMGEGANGFLLKPFKNEDLIKAVLSLVETEPEAPKDRDFTAATAPVAA